jgi:hypothetical protein
VEITAWQALKQTGLCLFVGMIRFATWKHVSVISICYKQHHQGKCISIIRNIGKMKPNMLIQAIINGSYGTTFLSRCREALVYRSLLFDMLDATMPLQRQLHVVPKRDIFGWVALNAIACEGEDRVERGETYKQLLVRNRQAGLRQPCGMRRMLEW